MACFSIEMNLKIQAALTSIGASDRIEETGGFDFPGLIADH